MRNRKAKARTLSPAVVAARIASSPEKESNGQILAVLAT